MRGTVWAAVLVAAAVTAAGPAGAQAMASRFARPAAGPQGRILAQDEARALAQARAAVAEMRGLARTPEEQALAASDGQIVETAARLVAERARLRAVLAAPVPPPPPTGPGGIAPSGAGQVRSGSASGGAGLAPRGAGAIGAAAGGGAQDQLLEATRAMQETQMSFNLQYLQLQSQMQHENRSYTAISNIMKTKHDTVKNSISNIR